MKNTSKKLLPCDKLLVNGQEPVMCNGKVIPVEEYWRWCMSDLISNTTRGAFAEFLVGKALGMEFTSARVDWDEYDLDYELNGTWYKLEVKTSGYIQSWTSKDHQSAIKFSIAPSGAWDKEKREYAGEKIRHSDAYIFCEHTDRNLDDAEPLDVARWNFYVLATSELNRHKEKQSTLSLSALKKLNPVECKFGDLKTALDMVLTDSVNKA